MRHLLRLHAYPSHRSLPFIQPHLVGNHCNEFAVGGLSAQVVDGVAEVAVQRVHIAPVPRHLNGMADGALHAAGSGTVFLGDFRVEAFGHSVDVLRLVHGEQDGIPQELIALDMSGNGIRVGNKSKSKSYYLLVYSVLTKYTSKQEKTASGFCSVCGLLLGLVLRLDSS